MISIITEDLTAFGTNPIVQTVMEHFEDHNYRTVLMNLRLYQKWSNTWYDNPEKVKPSFDPVIQEALAIRVNGIVYIAGHCRVINYFPPDFSIPTIISYGLSEGNKYPSIVINDEEGGYDITFYLLNKGHKKIGLIAGASDNMHTKNRLLGYQKALFESGVLYDPSLIYYGEWDRESGYVGAKALIGEGISAIFCMNDTMAAGVYDYLYGAGIGVGKEISVVGFDNTEKSEYLRPRLTTNAIQLSKIGKISAEELIKIIENKEGIKNEYEPIKVSCKVIERESVSSLIK